MTRATPSELALSGCRRDRASSGGGLQGCRAGESPRAALVARLSCSIGLPIAVLEGHGSGGSGGRRHRGRRAAWARAASPLVPCAVDVASTTPPRRCRGGGRGGLQEPRISRRLPRAWPGHSPNFGRGQPVSPPWIRRGRRPEGSHPRRAATRSGRPGSRRISSQGEMLEHAQQIAGHAVPDPPDRGR